MAMHQTLLPGTTLRTSRFILGTANLFNGQSAAAAERFLERAVELGFTHVDTAPLYGFGFAERTLAPVLRRHPSLTVTTKAGLYPPGGSDQSSLQILVRKAMGRVLPIASRARVDLSVARARRSLSASLRRLGRDRVELFLLHEPDLSITVTDEWHGWLDREKRDGRIGEFGLAGTRERVEPFLDRHPELAPVVQMMDTLDGREADILISRGRPLQITYGYVSGRATGDSVDGVLRGALMRNAQGAVIVSTRRIDRLDQYREVLGTLEGHAAS